MWHYEQKFATISFLPLLLVCTEANGSLHWKKIAASKSFEQKLSVGNKNFVMCSDDGFPHTLLTCSVVPNTVGKIKHLGIFVLVLLLIGYPR